MDISETSSSSSSSVTTATATTTTTTTTTSHGPMSHSNQVPLCLRNQEQQQQQDNGKLDNFDHTDTVLSSNDKNCSILTKTTTTQNATNCHPLMYTSTTTTTTDYPDLIPEKPTKHSIICNKNNDFHPNNHSTPTTVINSKTDDDDDDDEEILEKQLQYELNEYTEKLPDFPASPSVLKKSLLMFVDDLPLEISSQNGGDLSDTENNDKSIYEAHLSSNLQNVSLTMNEKEGNLNFLARNTKHSNKLRRVKVLRTQAVASEDCSDDDDDDDDDDISSLDSISESLKSENVFTGGGYGGIDDDNNKNNKDVSVEDYCSTPEPIEPLSAADERRHARNWQRMILPGGEQRTIDMRVIEPYKRVLSHGGYLRAGGHTAIVIFSACYLPDKSRIDYVYVMDNLFLYVLWTLERLITDDYILVYLHGCGPATKLPAFNWLKRCYQMVGRKLRKNLNHLYLVHPTLWIKTMLFMAKPFISSKFYRKITYISSLKELMIRVPPLETAAIPDKVKAYDNLHCVTTTTTT